jgi:drug/metabolite transporter (DMT)-like permease
LAGIGWGLYSLAGKASSSAAPGPAVTTADAFARGAIVVVPLTTLGAASLSLSAYGVLLATISGAVTSGVGYVIWYAALRHLTATRAALVQLSVPVIAAAGGAAFLGEEISERLMIAAIVILGSIALGVAARR